MNYFFYIFSYLSKSRAKSAVEFLVSKLKLIMFWINNAYCLANLTGYCDGVKRKEKLKRKPPMFFAADEITWGAKNTYSLLNKMMGLLNLNQIIFKSVSYLGKYCAFLIRDGAACAR